jgi:hydrogenase nickel incorporation protein HypA/HybF
LFWDAKIAIVRATSSMHPANVLRLVEALGGRSRRGSPMHELAVTQEIVEIASERAQGARVKRIVVEIGKLSAVLPDAVRFCFEVVAEGSPVEGAELEILETPGSARCRACAGLVALDRPFGRCSCGSTDLKWLSGEELRVKTLELV